MLLLLPRHLPESQRAMVQRKDVSSSDAEHSLYFLPAVLIGRPEGPIAELGTARLLGCPKITVFCDKRLVASNRLATLI